MAVERDLNKLAQKRAAERQVSIWYKLQAGDNCFRILPTPESKTTQGRWIDYALHREVGPNKDTVRCGKDPLNEHEGDCWICDELIPKLQRQGKDRTVALLEPKDTLAVQVASVDIDDGSMTGPFIFTPSPTLANVFLTNILVIKKRDYLHPKNGKNITVRRTGTGRNDTRYGPPMLDEDPSEVPAKIINKLKAFSELREIPSYSEAKQQAAWRGLDTVDEDQASTRKPKQAAVEEEEEIYEGDEAAEPEEEELEPEEELESEEEEPETERRPAKKPAPPAKKPAAHKAAPDEEEEPEPPRRKARKVAEEEEDIPDSIDEDEQQRLDEEALEEEEPEEMEPEPPRRPAKKAAVVPMRKSAKR